MPEPIEIVFYIHGVSPSEDVKEHTAEYNELHEGIQSSGVDPAWPPFDERGGAEWGYSKLAEQPKSHQALAQAQRVFGARLLPQVRDQWDLTISPGRWVVDSLRSIVFYGFGDMFYYTSQDGKRAVRQAVAGQILEHIQKCVGGSDAPISLTLLGHSAGSVIALDFLYFIFSKRVHRYLPWDDPSAVEDDGSAVSLEQCEMGLKKLRGLAESNRLRLRRLFTFGSPISFLAFRSDAVVEILARDERLRPIDHGLESSLEGVADLEGPRWINLWDKDDPIAWPVGPLMDSDLVEDVYVDVSDWVASAHTAYWKSPQMHKLIAQRW